MGQKVEARLVDPSLREALVEAVFVGYLPSIIRPDSRGVSKQEVTVWEINERHLPYLVFICLPNDDRIDEPIAVRYEKSVVQLAIPLASVAGQKRMYFNVDLINEMPMYTGTSRKPFQTDKTTLWIGYPDRGCALSASREGQKSNGVWVFTPDITQVFPQGQGDTTVYQATNVVFLDHNPFIT